MTGARPISHPILDKGMIHYCFKGMQMNSEAAQVVEQDGNVITVKRNTDEQILTFEKVGSKWLQRGHVSNKSLLFGTEFVYDKTKDLQYI